MDCQECQECQEYQALSPGVNLPAEGQATAGWTSDNLGMRCTADLLTKLLSLPARGHRLLIIRPGEEQHKCRGQPKRHASSATQGPGSRRPVRGVSTT